MFKEQVKILVYPRKSEQSGQIERLDSVRLDNTLQHLFDYLRERQYLVSLEALSHENLDNHSPTVLRLIETGNPAWVEMVPDRVAEKIKDGNLFGYAKNA